MADNLTVTQGSGTTIAADDVSGVLYQRVKIATGADGAVDGDLDMGQATMANSLPVAIASNQSAVPVTVPVGQQAMAASTPVAIASNQSAIPVTDNSGTLSVDDGGGVITVDGTVALGAGTAAIGKLVANSGVDIGDVDILSIAAGDNNIGNVDIASAIPSGTNLIGKVGIDQVTANANEVVVKSGTVTAVTAITNVVHVDDNSGSLTVDDGGNSLTVDISSITLAEKGQKTMDNSLPVTIANDQTAVPVSDGGGALTVDGTVALGAGTAAIGKLVANSGVDIGDVDILSIAAGDNNIGNVDVASLPVGQAAMAASTPVTIASDQSAVAVADGGGSLTVDVGTALPAGTNRVGYVTLKAIDPGLFNNEYNLACDGSLGYGILKVDVARIAAGASVALAASTESIGKLAANSGVDIGDVDVKSIAAGDNNIGNVDIASSLPAGTNTIGSVKITDGTDIATVDSSGNLNVNIANGTGVIEVDVNSFPVGQTTMAASTPVAIASDQSAVPVTPAATENQLGFVASPDIVITIDATVDTNAYAEGDVLFATQEVANACRVNAGTTILQSVTIADVDDQSFGIDLIFFDANTALGTENSAPDIDDTEIQTCIGRVSIASTTFYDMGANKLSCSYGIGHLMKAGAATTSLYMAGICRGTPTFAGGHIYIKLGFMRN